MTELTTTPASEEVPRALRAVLHSPQKARLLCLLERGAATSKDLAAALDPQIQANSVNSHLRELQTLGWVNVQAVTQNRGGFSRIWGLTTPGVSWSSFLAAVLDAAPQPAETVADEPTPLAS